jgi:hypothetical protein
MGMKRPRWLDGTRALEVAGVVGAVVLAAVVNVLAARHFTRWDWTHDRRWSLSPASIETLGSLERSVDVWAIAGPGDPLEASLRQLLTAYAAASSRVDVHWIDPDRDTVQLVDLQRRFGLEAGRTEDGRVATDAIVILASGDKHWFLTPSDMFEASGDEVHVKPREERAITGGLRNVVGAERAKLCFTVGHGELGLEPTRGDADWLGGLRDLLEKDNYDLASVDATAPDAHEPFAGCRVVVVAGPHAPFGPVEENRLRSWALEDGSVFLALGPVEGNTDTGMAGAGLDDVLGPFGIAANDDLVHDTDAAVAIPDTHGEGFFVQAHPHPVTAGLAPGAEGAHTPRIATFFTRSLRHVFPAGASPASDLLSTSDSAFSKTNITGASAWQDAPPRAPGDAAGPFVVAMASERPALQRGAPHGARVVVVGSRFALADDNWRQARSLHGMAFVVDGALSWLAARPAVVDVPDRADVAAGMRVSEEGRQEVRRYVLLLMPLAAALLGVAVWAWRRSSDDKKFVPRLARPGGETKS